MKSFIAKVRQTEQQPGVLSVSVIHGFMAGDVPDMGSHLLVITDNQPQLGQQLARQLGLAESARVVTIMPGSRMSELKYNTVACVGAAKRLQQREPARRFTPDGAF